MPPIAPPERPLSSEGAAEDEGEGVVDADVEAEAEAGKEVAEGVAEDAPGVVEVSARSCCLLTVYVAADGLAELREEKVSFSLVALRGRRGLFWTLQQMLNWPLSLVQSSLCKVSQLVAYASWNCN
jgi:hypothetical protein